MRRILTALSIVFLLTIVAYSQSGRKGSNAKPSATPTPTGPIELSPDASKDSKEFPKEVNGERIYKSREADERYQILKKPTPSYTREARRHLTRGVVMLRLILASDATVKHIDVVTGLPDGLTEKAI